MSELLITPLNAWHREHGVRMVPFAGWEMPVQYSGILDEHRQTRTAAGLFDICHMGEFIVSGPGAESALARIVTHDLTTLKPGKCRYGFMLNERGGVLDDLIVYRLEDERFMTVVNGACISSDLDWMRDHLPREIDIADRSMETAKIDLQGPRSFEVLARTIPGDWSGLGYFSFRTVTWDGYELLVSRTGYTGELGCEIYLPWNRAFGLWERLTADPDVAPAGLGARDTLRLEVGLPLYGQDLDRNHTPVEAGYGFMIKSQADFIGKAGLSTVRERLLPLVVDGRRSPRHGDEVLDPDGSRVGTVTSGSFAPSLGHCVALAYVAANRSEDDTFTIRSQRFEIPARKGTLPFYDQGTARMRLG
ncbi:MAG: glycine cleavage system aminomethyltransferase GcvT [Deltaproteobacteria bacterium]|nr:glycine cleavage system aminomethyltransferase GcvT [Deltaproteobacteria bacterium]